MNEPRQLCLICAFSGEERPASTRRKVFLPHDHTFSALLCPSHEDATMEQIKTAFLAIVDAKADIGGNP
jgi:hypothetical protein